MRMRAERDGGSGLAPTAYSTDAAPCPLTGDERVSHAASLWTDQVHSRFVEIRIELDPPAAGNDAFCALALMPHRS